MMTFEEFFKKKKIDLVQLKTAEPVLFAEFESHYTQMGEKSFDHTKKYWFNNLRRLYHTPEEPKVEKVKIDNPLAEQTITESLAEKAETPAPKVGFTPRFKAGATKPAEATPPVEPGTETSAVVGVPTNNQSTEDAPKPKVGFTPRFKAGVTKPTEATTPPVEPVAEAPKEESPVASDKAPKPKVGFTPRFKAGVTKPAEAPTAPKEIPKEENPAVADEAPKPKIGFTPRFKARVTKPATEQPVTESEIPKTEPSLADETPAVVGVVTNNPEAGASKAEESTAPAEKTPKPKIGFTPRFKAGVTKPQKEDEE